MISIKHKFLFVHIPKTGGNSIQQILRNYSEDFVATKSSGQDGFDRFDINDRYRTKKHSPLWYYRLVLPRSIYMSLYKFAIIRNPWERLISYYFSPHRKVTEWDRSLFLAILPEVKPVGYYLHPVHPFIYHIQSVLSGHMTPLDADVDFVLRFENLEADFKRVCGEIGIPFAPLDHRNKSAHEHYSHYYDDELISVVRAKYQEEINWGSYDFERE
jgi:hypothetical protein